MKKGEYKVIDKEILMGFYKKLLWDRTLPHIPVWITPNMITVLGQVSVLVAVLIAYVAGHGHYLLFPLSSIFLIGYLTADNLDGPHARRTGQSSPLGEMLDHGLDGLASGAVLICTAFTLKVDGLWLASLCVLGAVGFIVQFWEQTRRGVLVIPEVSGAEGVTLLVLMQLIIFLGGNPTWMAFDPSNFANLATIIMVVVLVGYAAAIFPPIYRIRKAGIFPWEILPILAVTAPMMFYVVKGANAMIPAIAVSIYSANFVCRAITMRHQSKEGPVIRPFDALPLLPLAPLFLAPDLFQPNHLAAAALGLAVLHYGINLIQGITILGRTEVESGSSSRELIG